MLQIDTIS